MKIATPLKWLLAGLFILLLGMVFIPAYQEAKVRSKAAITKGLLLEVGQALEAYYADHHAYPPAVPLRNYANDPGADTRKIPFSQRIDAPLTPLERAGGLDLFAISSALTTPVPYLKALPPDPFINVEHTSTRFPGETRIPFAYYVYNDIPEPAWFLISPGPDGDYDITNPPEIYDPEKRVISRKIRSLNYDPQYGESSNGDVFRYHVGDKAFTDQ